MPAHSIAAHGWECAACGRKCAEGPCRLQQGVCFVKAGWGYEAVTMLPVVPTGLPGERCEGHIRGFRFSGLRVGRDADRGRVRLLHCVFAVCMEAGQWLA